MSSGYFRAYSEKVRQATRDLDERNLRVYIALLTYSDCRGKCWPGIKTLVNDTGLCTDAVYEALEALLTRKYIAIVRRGTRDAETGYSLPNIYKVDGVVTDDESCPDIEQMDGPILESSSTQESNTTRTDSELTKPESTKPETPPPTQPISSNDGEGKGKNQRKTGKEKTPGRSPILNSPPPVPPAPSQKYYTGPLDDWAEPLPDAQEKAAELLHDRVERKLPLRLARKLVAEFGQANVDIALAHLAKQKDIYNPAGYVRALLERRAVEQADAQPVNPGDAYVTGALKDYIIH